MRGIGRFLANLARESGSLLPEAIEPSKALAVAYLIPLFALAWGWLFLGEGVTPVMVGAGSVILLGTALATGLIGARTPGHR